MADCNFLAPNSEKSVLYAALEQHLGTDRAIQMWNLVKSKEYQAANPHLAKDVNGEPTYEAVVNNTKRQDIGLNSLNTSSIEAFKESYNKILASAALSPKSEHRILFTTGTAFEIGGVNYTGDALANLLDEPRTGNVTMTESMNAAIANLAKNFSKDLIIKEANPLHYQEESRIKQMRDLFVEMRDSDGKPLGVFYEAEKQNEIVDSILGIVYNQFTKDPSKSAGEHASDVLINLKNKREIFNRIANGTPHPRLSYTAEQATTIRNDYDAIIQSFYFPGEQNSFWHFALAKLAAYGITVNVDDRLMDTSETVTIKDEDGSNAAIELNMGQSLRDFYDNSFEIDTRDTASTRMKMFLMSIPKSRMADETMPPSISLAISDTTLREAVERGQTTELFRTAAQAEAMGFKPGANYVTKINGKDFRVEVKNKLTAEQAAAQPAENGVQAVAGDYAISVTRYIQKKNILSSEPNFLGMNKLVPFQDIFQKLTATLAGREVSYEGYIQALKETKNPDLHRVAEKLEASEQHVKNEFTAVMSTQYQRMLMVMQKKNAYGGIETYILDSNRGSEEQTLMKHWQESQKSSPIMNKDENGITRVNQKLAKELHTELTAINALPYITPEEKAVVETRTKDLLIKTLEANGIVLDSRTIDDLMEPETLRKLLRGKSLFGLTGVSKKGNATGLLSAIITKLHTGDTEADKSTLEETENLEGFKANNPLYTEKNAMRALAKAQAPYAQGLFTSTHKNTEGKNIYAYGLNTSLSHAIRKLTTDSEYLKQFSNVPFAKNAWLLKSLKDSSGNAGWNSKFELTYLDGIKNRSRIDQKGNSRGDMSDREQHLMALGLFQNKDGQLGSYLSLTHSDKTTSPVLMNLPKEINLRDGYTGKYRDHILKTVYESVFLAEYDRINANAKVNVAKYEQGSKYFYMLPMFNYEVMQELVKTGEITAEDLKNIWASDKQLNSVATKGFKATIAKMLSMQLDDMIDSTVSAWRESGLLDVGIPGSKQYIDRILNSEGLYVDNGELFAVDGRPIHGNAKEATIRAIATDYTINSFLVNTSLAQLVYGDPALVFKGNLAKTFIEYGKRLAKDIAPGRDGAFEHSPTYVTITAKDYSPIVKELQGMPGYAEGVDATDAQEFVTVKEHVNVLYAYGKISQEQWEKAVKRINDAKGGFYTLEDLNIPMHPMKPVAAGLRAQVNGVMSYDYVKSSSIPLYPPITAGLELDKLRRGMENTGVDRVNFSTAKKIGAPVKAVELFDESGNINEDVFKSTSWTGGEGSTSSARQTLDRSEFRIQQETPYDETKEKIRTVSQMNKLITQGIELIQEPFKIGDRTFNGKQMRAYKENIRKQLLDYQFQDYLASIGATLTDSGVKFENKQKLYELLKHEALNRSGYSVNDLAAIQSFVEGHTLTVPLMFTPNASRFEGLLMSTIKNMVNVKMPGKSYVQATPAGFKTMQTWEESNLDKSKIVWAGEHNGELTTTHIDAAGIVQAAKVLVPWNFLNKEGSGKLDINKFLLKEGETGYEAGKLKINMEKVPKELLQLIGARIPNQKHSSMLPIEIAGFLPAEMGDTIVVPAAITKQMGSDFDVDKLYTYKRSYIYKDGKLSVPVHDVNAQFVPIEGREVTREKAEAKWNAAQQESHITDLKNQYFDVHWSILTNKEMHPRVVAPLDINDLAKEAEELGDKNTKPNYFFSPAQQLKDFQSMKTAKGGVGTSSLAVTNNAVIEDKDVYLIGAVKTDVGYTMERKPITVLDRKGNPVELTHLSGYGVSYYKGDATKMRSKADNLVVQQNENVDNAKNQVVGKVNLNDITSAASYAISRLQTEDTGKPGQEGFEPGQALDLEYNAKLLAQPIIREFVAEMGKRGDSMSMKSSADPKADVFAELQANYKQILQDSNYKPNPIGVNELAAALKMQPGTKAFAQAQLDALNLFRQFDSVGAQLTQLQTLTTQDTRGAGEDMLSVLDIDNRMRSFGTDNNSTHLIQGLESIYHNDGSPTEVGKTYDITVKTARDLFYEDLPYHKLTGLFDYITEQSGRTDMSIDTKKKIVQHMKSYAFSNPNMQMWEDATAERARLMFSLDGRKSLAQRIADAKESWGKNNYFLQRLTTDIDPDNLKPHYVSYDAAKAANVDDLENNRAWIELLSSTNPEAKKLGEDLVKYTYLTGGVQSAKNFIKYLPFSYIEGTPIAAAIRNLHANIGDFAKNEAFRIQYYQHNPKASLRLSSDFSEAGLELESAPNMFTVAPISLKEELINPAKKLQIPLNGRQAYPEFVHHVDPNNRENVTLYRKARQTGDSAPGGVTYYKIDTLGNKNMTEYSLGAGMGRSIISSNRSTWWKSLAPDVFEKMKKKDGNEPQMNNLEAQMLHAQNTAVVAKQIGLERSEGTVEDIHKALSNIAADKQQSNPLRVVAGILSEMHHMPMEGAFHELLGIEKRLSFGIDLNAQPGNLGSYMPGQNRIKLAPATFRDKGTAAQTLIHEMLHYHTTWMMLAFADEATQLRYMGGNVERVEALKALREEIEKDPVLTEKIKALGDIRETVLDAIKQDIIAQEGEDNWNERFARISSGGNLFDNFDKLIYGAQNDMEFITHALSNPEFMTYLNGKEYKGEKISLLDKVKELFAKVWGAVMKTMGIKQNSLLEESVKRTLDVVMYKQQNDVTLTAKNLPDFSAFYNSQLSLGNQAIFEDDDMEIHATDSHSTTVEKILGKLNEQLIDLKDSRTGVTSREERLSKDTLIDKVQEQIDALTYDSTILRANQVGKDQLAWVLDVAKKEHPTANELNTAIRMASMWGGVISLVYDGTEESVDSGLAELNSAAQKSMSDLIAKSKAFIEEASNGAVRPKVDWTPAELKDLDGFNSNLRSLTSAAESRVLQFIGTYVENTSKHRDEEARNEIKKLHDLEKRMLKHVGGDRKALKTLQNRFLQSSSDSNDKSWGLNSTFSGKWFSYLKKAKTTLRGELAHIPADGADKAQNTHNQRERRIAWNGYWLNLKQNAAFVNTAKFFEPITGVLKEGHEKHLAELEKQVGVSAAADMLKTAQAKYKAYLEERDAVFAHIDTLELSEEETKAQREAYIAAYSPNAYFSHMNSVEDPIASKWGDKYVTMQPKAEHTQFFDKSHLDLKADETLYGFFQEYKAYIDKMKSYMPLHEQARMGDTFLPIVNKSLIRDALDFPALIKGLQENTIRSLTSTQWEEDMNNADIARIPTDFTKENKVSLEDRSTDLVKIAEMFTIMALHYKHFSQAKDFIQMSQQVVSHIHTNRIAGSEQTLVNGKLVTTSAGLEHAMKALNFLVDHSMLKKPKKIEGISNSLIYSEIDDKGSEKFNIFKSNQIDKRVRELTIQKNALNERYVNQEIELEDYKKELDKIDEELNRYVGHKFTGSKLGDKLIGINQMKALAFNPFSAVANMTFGVISTVIHGSGKTDFTNKEAYKAMKLMLNSTAKWVTFGTKESETAEKILNTMENLGVMGDYVESMYGKTIELHENKPKWKQLLDPFSMMRSSDYFMKGMSSIAVMMHKQVEVTENGVKKTISVWDAMSKEGKWDSAKYGENKAWLSDNPHEQTEWDKMRNRIDRVNMVIHGNQNKNSPKMLNSSIWGRLLGQFRLSWLPEGFYSRFQDERTDLALERQIKGRYRTLSDIGLFASLKVIGKSAVNLIPGVSVDPYTGITLPKGTGMLADSAVDIENMRRNLSELAFGLGITAMILMLKSLKDKDEPNPALQLVINMLIRGQQDIDLYASPSVFDTVTRNPIPVTQVFKDYGALLSASNKLIMGDENMDFNTWLMKVMKAGLPIPQAALIPKTIFMLKKDLGDQHQ